MTPPPTVESILAGDTGRRRSAEHAHQCALFAWARLARREHPALKLLEGSMNGVRLTPAQAAKAKAAGMLKGAPDVRLPVPRGSYVGLAIEMKHGRNSTTAEQEEVGRMMIAEGHYWAVCYDWQAARDLVLRYLAGDPPPLEAVL